MKIIFGFCVWGFGWPKHCQENTISIDVTNGFKAQGKIIMELKKLAKSTYNIDFTSCITVNDSLFYNKFLGKYNPVINSNHMESF